MPTSLTPPAPVKSKDLIVRIESVSKLYSDDMGRFPVRSRSGNYFIMLAYQVDCNVILIESFQSRHDRHRLAAADRIMTRIQKNAPLTSKSSTTNAASPTNYKSRKNVRQSSNLFPLICTAAT